MRAPLSRMANEKCSKWKGENEPFLTCKLAWPDIVQKVECQYRVPIQNLNHNKEQLI